MNISQMLGKFKMKPLKAAPYLIIFTLVVAVIAILVAGKGSLVIPEKQIVAGIFGALIAALATIILLLLKAPDNTQKIIVWLFTGYLVTFFIVIFVFARIPIWEDYWTLVEPTTIQLETVFNWVAAAFIAAAVIFVAALVTMWILGLKTQEKIQKLILCITIGALVGALVTILLLVRETAVGAQESILKSTYWVLVLALVPIEISLMRMPNNPQRGILWTIIFSLVATLITIFGFASMEEVEDAQSIIFYGAAAALIVALTMTFIPLFAVWFSSIKPRFDPRKMSWRMGSIALVAALIALFIFAWIEAAPSQKLVLYGSTSAFIIVFLMIYLLIPFIELMRNLFGRSKAEKIELTIGKSKDVWGQYKHSRFGMFGLIVLIIVIFIAVFGPTLAPEDPLEPKDPGSQLPQPPSSEYWFGTDFEDKDVWSQFLWGARISLIVGILAGLLSAVIGTTVGITAGYFGRVSDEVLMRFTDFFLVIPWLPLMIVLIAIIGRSFWVVIFVIGIVSWAPTARVVRAAVLSIKQKQYIERSIALGSGTSHIVTRHIFPNVFPIIVATTILLVAEAIFSEAFLDFFGLGDPNVVSWGWMLERAHEYNAMVNWYWWWITPPSLGIIVLIMAFYLIGDTLDDILNPRLKRR